MDIHQWLAAAADRAPPDQPEFYAVPHTFRAHPPTDDGEQRPGHRCKRKQRASSDSSIMAPRLKNPGHPPPDSWSLSSERSGSAEDARELRQHYPRCSRSTARSLKHEKTYERRPRHKTRPDRYQPKVKKQKGQRQGRRSERKKRCKSHRSGDGGRTAGLVQSSQLKNRPKNNRLTLRPGATAGLFKHGRASAQVTGRGTGLPDLVFNELKFLQRPSEHQNEAHDATEQQRRSKKERKRPDEGEMSAYFHATKPANDEFDQNKDARVEGIAVSQSRDAARKNARQKHITPPLELPARPFLRFGSKGGPREAQDLHSERTTYLTWSQSPSRGQSAGRRQLLVAPKLKRGQLSADGPRRTPPHLKPDHRPSDHTRSDEQTTRPRRSPPRDRWAHSNRGKGDLFVDVRLQTLPLARRSHDGPRSTTKTTTQSLPRAHIAQCAMSQRPMDSDYRTSDILKLHNRAGDGNGPFHRGDFIYAEPQAEKEDEAPASTLSIDRLLNDARHFSARRNIPKAVAGASSHKGHKTQLKKNLQEASMLSGVRHPSPVRDKADRAVAQASNHSHAVQRRHAYTAEKQSCVPLQPPQRHADGQPMIHVSQEQDSASHDWDCLPQRFPAREKDEEMLDNAVDDRVGFRLREPVYANLQQAEELAHGYPFIGMPGVYEQPPGHLQSMAASQWEHRSNTSAERSVSIGVPLGSEPWAIRTSARTEDDMMSGFWKPHKLC